MAFKLQDIGRAGTSKTDNSVAIQKSLEEERERQRQLAEEARQRRIKAQQEYLEKIKEASLYMAAYCKHLEGLEEIVKKTFTGNTASQIEAEIQGMYDTCQTVLNGLNNIGNDTANKIQGEGGVAEYSNTLIPFQDAMLVDTNQTFSCNTDILRLYVLPEIQNINENLTKMSSALGEINVPEGCKGVGQIPSTLSTATQQTNNIYGQVAQFINDTEKAEEENLDLIQQIGQGISDIFGKFLIRNRKKTQEAETGEIELPKLKGTWETFNELMPQEIREQTNDFLGLKESDQLPNFSNFNGFNKEKSPVFYDPEDPSAGMVYDCIGEFKRNMEYDRTEEAISYGCVPGYLMSPKLDEDDESMLPLTISLPGKEDTAQTATAIFDATEKGDMTYNGYTWALISGFGDPNAVIKGMDEMAEKYKNLDTTNIEITGFSENAPSAPTLALQLLKKGVNVTKVTMISAGNCVVDDIKKLQDAGVKVEIYYGKSGDDAIKFYDKELKKHDFADVTIIDGGHNISEGGVVDNYYSNYAHGRQETFAEEQTKK